MVVIRPFPYIGHSPSHTCSFACLLLCMSVQSFILPFYTPLPCSKPPQVSFHLSPSFRSSCIHICMHPCVHSLRTTIHPTLFVRTAASCLSLFSSSSFATFMKHPGWLAGWLVGWPAVSCLLLFLPPSLLTPLLPSFTPLPSFTYSLSLLASSSRVLGLLDGVLVCPLVFLVNYLGEKMARPSF